METGDWKEGNTYEVVVVENQLRDGIMARDPNGKIIHFRKNGHGLDPDHIPGGAKVWAKIIKDKATYYIAVIEKVVGLPPTPDPVIEIQDGRPFDHKTDIYRRAVKKWGKDAQLWQTVEELAEFLDALAKRIRGRPEGTNLPEEIADLEIMLEQVCIIFGIHRKEVEDIKKQKLARLMERLQV